MFEKYKEVKRIFQKHGIGILVQDDAKNVIKENIEKLRKIDFNSIKPYKEKKGGYLCSCFPVKETKQL